MKPEIIAAMCIFVGFAIAEALRTGFLRKPLQRGKDVAVEILSGGVLLSLTQPLILIGSALLMKSLFPEAENALAETPIWQQVLLFLLLDDMMQYWWHRLSHTLPWLYKLHRPHHDAPYMSIRIVYRNNIFYYALMPGLWFSGALIYLGMGEVYAFYLVTKLSVIYGAHSDVRWDEPLYKIKALHPLMWLLERTISTPATHSAHHGKHAEDGVTHYKGNYGNLLFFWDVLFGTAKITRRYPQQYGVENLHEAGVGEQLLWPLLPSDEGKHPPATETPRS